MVVYAICCVSLPPFAEDLLCAVSQRMKVCMRVRINVAIRAGWVMAQRADRDVRIGGGDVAVD